MPGIGPGRLRARKRPPRGALSPARVFSLSDGRLFARTAKASRGPYHLLSDQTWTCGNQSRRPAASSARRALRPAGPAQAAAPWGQGHGVQARRGGGPGLPRSGQEECGWRRGSARGVLRGRAWSREEEEGWRGTRTEGQAGGMGAEDGAEPCGDPGKASLGDSAAASGSGLLPGAPGHSARPAARPDSGAHGPPRTGRETWAGESGRKAARVGVGARSRAGPAFRPRVRPSRRGGGARGVRSSRSPGLGPPRRGGGSAIPEPLHGARALSGLCAPGTPGGDLTRVSCRPGLSTFFLAPKPKRENREDPF